MDKKSTKNPQISSSSSDSIRMPYIPKKRTVKSDSHLQARQSTTKIPPPVNSISQNNYSTRIPYMPKTKTVKSEKTVRSDSHLRPHQSITKTPPPVNSINQSNSSTRIPYIPKVNNVGRETLTQKAPYSQYSQSSSQHSQKTHTVNHNPPQYLKPHLIIDTYSGEYTLLNSNYNVVAKTYCNPILYHFINRYRLHKFKKELKRDYKDYKKDCKRKKIPLDDDLKKSYKAIKFYIWFCPDANFNILELLKNNITKTDSKYKNYQSACYDYLHELASLKYGDPEKMGFDIVLATLDGLSGSNHRYISDIIVRSNNTVNDYIKAHRVSSNPSQPINNSHTTPSYIPRQNSIGSIAVQPVSRSNIYRDR